MPTLQFVQRKPSAKLIERTLNWMYQTELVRLDGNPDLANQQFPKLLIGVAKLWGEDGPPELPTDAETAPEQPPMVDEETPDVSYNLTMFEPGGDSAQDIDLSRAEFIALKRYLNLLRTPAVEARSAAERALTPPERAGVGPASSREPGPATV